VDGLVGSYAGILYVFTDYHLNGEILAALEKSGTLSRSHLSEVLNTVLAHLKPKSCDM